MAEKLIKRSFEIYERQDTALDGWAEKLPDLSKSAVARIVIELGLAEFGESRITQALQDGAIQLFNDESLTMERAERKKRSSAKLRS